MFDGTTKSVLMTGSVGQMAVYSVSDETDDSGKTQTYFESKMLFGINGKYTFKFSDDKQKVVLTNTEDKKTTTLQRLATYEYIPIPSEKPKIDNKLLGAWKCDDGEMLYFNNSGIMYKVMTGINFYFATYNADGKTVNWQYSYKESKPKNEKADYSISGNTLTFDNSRGEFHMIQQRNIAVCIILSIVTCGIYGIYWLICLNDDANRAANDPNATSGGIVFLLTLVTCGIYGIYWCYKMGQQLDTAYQNRGVPAPGKGTILLILAIFGLSIISYALIQDDLNKISAMDGGVQA